MEMEHSSGAEEEQYAGKWSPRKPSYKAVDTEYADHKEELRERRREIAAAHKAEVEEAKRTGAPRPKREFDTTVDYEFKRRKRARRHYNSETSIYKKNKESTSGRNLTYSTVMNLSAFKKRVKSTHPQMRFNKMAILMIMSAAEAKMRKLLQATSVIAKHKVIERHVFQAAEIHGIKIDMFGVSAPALALIKSTIGGAGEITPEDLKQSRMAYKETVEKIIKETLSSNSSSNRNTLFHVDRFKNLLLSFGIANSSSLARGLLMVYMVNVADAIAFKALSLFSATTKHKESAAPKTIMPKHVSLVIDEPLLGFSKQMMRRTIPVVTDDSEYNEKLKQRRHDRLYKRKTPSIISTN